MQVHPATNGIGDPFDLTDQQAYLRWRDWKLSVAPPDSGGLIVQVRDPAALRPAELAAIIDRCRRCNIAVVAGPANAPDRQAARRLGEQLGLRKLDANWLADEDGISTLTSSDRRDRLDRQDFIPYTDRPMRWHSDGYYNPPQRRIAAMMLYCIERADSGGGNRLLDHEIAYLLLRDADPRFIQALSVDDAMMIPRRDQARDDQIGPVFSRIGSGEDLHMRFTARTRSIAWRQDDATLDAVHALTAVLDAAGSHVYSLVLEPGMAIVCNNVLHQRDGFVDSGARRREVLRARYLDRIEGAVGSWRE
ncbi:MAG: TauD/TfdA family dioxygenase, partial [Quisquiliibacterium sp.]